MHANLKNDCPKFTTIYFSVCELKLFLVKIDECFSIFRLPQLCLVYKIFLISKYLKPKKVQVILYIYLLCKVYYWNIKRSVKLFLIKRSKWRLLYCMCQRWSSTDKILHSLSEGGGKFCLNRGKIRTFSIHIKKVITTIPNRI